MIKKIIRTSLLFSVLPLSCLDAAPSAAGANDPEKLSDYSRGIVGYQFGNKNGFTLDVFVPIAGDLTEFWFINPQAYTYDSLYRTYSLGFGHRQAANDTVYGAYAYYDKQRSPQQFYYDRMNLGFQSLGKDWAWNANLYWYGTPSAHNVADQGISQASIVGNEIEYLHQFLNEEAYSGISAEIGRRIFDTMFAYAGYYSYSQIINGTKFRLEYNLNNGLMLGASTQFDKARGWLHTININYWIGKKLSGKNSITDRMRAPIVRDTTVAAYSYQTNVTETDSRHIYFVSGDAENSDDMTLTEALAHSNTGDFIYLKGNAGTIDLGGNQITLDGSRQLISSVDGFSPIYQGKSYSILSGNAEQRPTLINGGFLITGSTTLKNMDMDGTNSSIANALDIEQATNVLIQNMAISNYANSGVTINGSTVQLDNIKSIDNLNGALIKDTGLNQSHVIINHSNFTHTNSLIGQGKGIDFENGHSLVLQDVNVDHFLIGIEIDGVNANAILDSVNSTNNAQDGLAIGKTNATGSENVTLTGGNYSNNTDYGIYVEGSADTQLAMQNTTIAGNNVGLVTFGATTTLKDSIFTQNRIGNIMAQTDGHTSTRSNITITGSELNNILEQTGNYNILTRGADIIFNDPSVLIGELYINTAATNDTIQIIKNGVTEYTITNATNNHNYQCNISNSTGTCSNIS